MELMHQLTPKLKQLRLSGVLETLDARHRQAIDGQWTHVEFLARLLEDEVERRAQKQLALRTATRHRQHRQDAGKLRLRLQPALSNARRCCSWRVATTSARSSNVLVCGPTGVGKSHLVQALAPRGPAPGL